MLIPFGESKLGTFWSQPRIRSESILRYTHKHNSTWIHNLIHILDLTPSHKHLRYFPLFFVIFNLLPSQKNKIFFSLNIIYLNKSLPKPIHKRFSLFVRRSFFINPFDFHQYFFMERVIRLEPYRKFIIVILKVINRSPNRASDFF